VTGRALPTLSGFLLGSGAAVAVGLVFHFPIFRPDTPAFQFVTLGTLTAAVLVLVRAGLGRYAVVLVSASALAHFGLVRTESWTVTLTTLLAALLLGFGLLLVGVIFDMLAHRGIWFGKFLIVGPLLGGLLLALSPISEFHRLSYTDAVSTLLRQTALGVIIGQAVGCGVEISELFTESWKRKPAVESPR